MTPRRRWALLVCVASGLLMISLDHSVLYTALPTLTEELGASSSESLWIINAYPLAMAGLLLGAGTLGDRVGHRRMFLIGMTIFGIASLAAAFASGPLWLIVARAFLAVGAAAMMPSTLALIRLAFENQRERNLAIGVWGSVSVLGSALGPVVGGILIEKFWWGAVFLINVPVVLVAIAVTWLVAPKTSPDDSRSWDLVSSLQVMVGLVGFVTLIKELFRVDSSWLVLSLSGAAATAGFLLFTMRQRRLAYPLLDFSIFRNRVFVAGIVTAGVIMFAFGGVQLVTSQRFQYVAQFSPMQAGMLVSIVSLGLVPSALLGGAVLHRVGYLPLIAGGLAFSCAALAAMALALSAGTVWFAVALFLGGIGAGAPVSVASSAIMGSVPPARAGMASSVEEVSYELGTLMAVAFFGSFVAASYTAAVDLPGDVPELARASIGGALSVAEQSPDFGTDIVAAASLAYDSAFYQVLVIAAVAVGLAAVVTGTLLRGHSAQLVEQSEEPIPR